MGVLKNTEVSLPDRTTKNIEDLEEDEEILSCKIEFYHGKTTPSEALRWSSHFPLLEKIIAKKNVSWEDGEHYYIKINNKLKVSFDQLIFCKESEDSFSCFKIAKTLKKDFFLLNDKYEYEKIKSVKRIKKKEKIMSISFEINNTYFANGYLIHNASPCSSESPTSSTGPNWRHSGSPSVKYSSWMNDPNANNSEGLGIGVPSPLNSGSCAACGITPPSLDDNLTIGIWQYDVAPCGFHHYSSDLYIFGNNNGKGSGSHGFWGWDSSTNSFQTSSPGHYHGGNIKQKFIFSKTMGQTGEEGRMPSGTSTYFRKVMYSPLLFRRPSSSATNAYVYFYKRVYNGVPCWKFVESLSTAQAEVDFTYTNRVPWYYTNPASGKTTLAGSIPGKWKNATGNRVYIQTWSSVAGNAWTSHIRLHGRGHTVTTAGGSESAYESAWWSINGNTWSTSYYSRVKLIYQIPFRVANANTVDPMLRFIFRPLVSGGNFPNQPSGWYYAAPRAGGGWMVFKPG